MPDSTVKITGSLIKAGESRNGGWSHAQLSVLGVEIPLVKGWRGRLTASNRNITKAAAELFVALKDAHLTGEGRASSAPLEAIIADLERQLARERARLDWWARRSLDSCTMDSAGHVGCLDQDNIRASIDSYRRRELAEEARRARGEPWR